VDLAPVDPCSDQCKVNTHSCQYICSIGGSRYKTACSGKQCSSAKVKQASAQAGLLQTLLPGSDMKLYYILSSGSRPAFEAHTACKRSLSTYSNRWDSSKTACSDRQCRSAMFDEHQHKQDCCRRYYQAVTWNCSTLRTESRPALEAHTACKRSLSTYSSRWDSSKTVPEAELYAPLHSHHVTQLFLIAALLKHLQVRSEA
jgi:hypothetical protein